MKWLTGNDRIVPMVMFHSIGLESHDWSFRHIAEPVLNFEEKISFLAHAGFNFITWGELYAYMQGDIRIDLPAIVLTFDDGYLDNWVYAYPIMKKYGAKGTIFVSTEFIDPSTTLRPNLDDVESGHCHISDLQKAGFLSWREMAVMQNSGVIDIQSHAATHTWYPSGPGVVDFWKPGQQRHEWMAWNQRKDRKPFYLSESQEGYVEFGMPVYEHEKSLLVRRFLPAPEIAAELTEHVQANGGQDYFKNHMAIERLHSRHEDLLERFSSGCRYETDEERKKRIFDELSSSKSGIEKELGKPVDFICWPGGAYDELTLEVAREVGFKAWTLGSKDKSDARNLPGGDPMQVKRIGSAPKQYFRGRELGWTGGREFLYGVRCHQGSFLHKWSLRGLKILRAAGVGQHDAA